MNPGEWTDDTSMALCLADSLIACGGVLTPAIRWTAIFAGEMMAD